MNKCPECGKKFKPIRFWQRYCSPLCKNRVNQRTFRANHGKKVK